MSIRHWSDIPGWTDVDMLQLYAEWAEEFVPAKEPAKEAARPTTIVEVGVAYGRSFAFLLTVVHPEVLCVAVDTFHEHVGKLSLPPGVFETMQGRGTPREAFEECVYGATRRVAEGSDAYTPRMGDGHLLPYHVTGLPTAGLPTCRTDPSIRAVGLPSVEAAKLYGDRTLDAVFIDADHGYGACKADILAWLPKVRVGGMLAGHDYSLKNHPGVVSAVNEVLTAPGPPRGPHPVQLHGVVWRHRVK